MDVATIASALFSAQAGQLQVAVAARVLQMNAHMEAATVQQLLQTGQPSPDSLANLASGTGGSLNISV
jgi:hypothetical protein